MSASITSLLDDLGTNELDILLRSGQKKAYAKHMRVIDEGDRSDCAYYINSGQVKVFLSDENGKEIVLSMLKAGDYFGEMALIDQEVRSAAVITTEESELTVITQKSFREYLRSHPEIAEHIMLGLVTRLREANKKISSLALMDAHQRVANMLLEMANERDGQLVIDEKPTQQHIANIVGVSREMISRIMKNMVTDGHIQIESKKIIILDENFS